jgi:hypothetical protein
LAKVDSDAAPRLSRSLLRQAETWHDLPLSALAAQCQVRRCVAELEHMAVKRARELGANWEDIADALGVSRQAIQQRYGKVREHS